MAQVARNLSDAFDGFLTGYRFLICDRDSKFSEQFRRILRSAGVDVIPTPGSYVFMVSAFRKFSAPHRMQWDKLFEISEDKIFMGIRSTTQDH